MKLQKYQVAVLQVTYMWILMAIIVACTQGGQTDYLESPTPDGSGGTLDLNNPAPPNTDVSAQPDFDFFAWNTFIALNWPAVIPSSSNNYQRGFPNVNKAFANASASDLTVWETYKEKREVFNQDGNDPGAWNSEVDYGKIRTSDTTTIVDPTTTRTFHQGTKMLFDSFDETVQVASEALEDSITDASGKRIANPIKGRPVGPRIWRGMPSDNNPVVYEVKVNYDFYQYVRENQLYVKNTNADGTYDPNNPVAQKAIKAGIALPYRTSATSGPSGAPASTSTRKLATGYSSATTRGVYDTLKPSDTAPPPLIGAVHLKAAWIKLDPAKDDVSSYHNATGQYFVDSAGLVVPRTGTFGLIGLHIIQRIHTGKSGDANGGTTGGTFIFATWEHVKNDSELFTYSNYYKPEDDPNPIKPPAPYNTAQFIPDLANPFTVARRYQPISNANPMGTQQVNEAVHAAIKAVDPSSVWLNYRLIGTQFSAMNVSDKTVTGSYPASENDPTGIGQPLFLANLVIETNDGLQHFEGQPPQTFTISQYSIDSNKSVLFTHNTANMSFNGTPKNMGGCMGCHGVIQSRGYSFSFVLFGGYFGAKTDTQEEFDIPPNTN